MLAAIMAASIWLFPQSAREEAAWISSSFGGHKIHTLFASTIWIRSLLHPCPSLKVLEKL
jgi:hypothetical protein